jgi:hypothetical protein
VSLLPTHVSTALVFSVDVFVLTPSDHRDILGVQGLRRLPSANQLGVTKIS